MGTVRFPNRGNGWWIFSRTALVESRIHSTLSLVFQDERSEQKQGAGVNRILILLASLFLVGCSDDSWYCVEDGERMYSRSTTGEWGGAKRGCSCSEIRSFEKRIFGEVDEAALRRDFGC